MNRKKRVINFKKIFKDATKFLHLKYRHKTKKAGKQFPTFSSKILLVKGIHNFIEISM